MIGKKSQYTSGLVNMEQRGLQDHGCSSNIPYVA